MFTNMIPSSRTHAKEQQPLFAASGSVVAASLSVSIISIASIIYKKQADKATQNVIETLTAQKQKLETNEKFAQSKMATNNDELHRLQDLYNTLQKEKEQEIADLVSKNQKNQLESTKTIAQYKQNEQHLTNLNNGLKETIKEMYDNVQTVFDKITKADTEVRELQEQTEADESKWVSIFNLMNELTSSVDNLKQMQIFTRLPTTTEAKKGITKDANHEDERQPS